MRWNTVKIFAHTYIQLIYLFCSAYMKTGVWIKADPQLLFPAEPDVKNGWANPNSISRLELI